MNSRGLAGKIASSFIDSHLTPLLIVAALLLGIFAILQTPREEEPQIIVPMIDIFVQMPGASEKEVEERVTTPMEKLLWEIPGVEYSYSTSRPGFAMAVVRFYVGEDEEESILKVYTKLYANLDKIPPGVSPPLVKPRSIDDVPILSLTFWGKGYDEFLLRRLAAEVEDAIKTIPDVSETSIIGGWRRQFVVTLDPARLAAHQVTPVTIVSMIQQANQQLPAGRFTADNVEFLIETGGFLQTPEEIGAVVVGNFAGRPVYLRDVATIIDGVEEPDHYVFLGLGPAAEHKGISLDTNQRAVYPAVTISVAKRKGTNAIRIADKILTKVRALQGTLLPGDVQLTVTRNYGETAQEKSDELLKHLLIATVSVILLIALALGWRESGVVALAVPVTLALTLLVFYLYGYTLNRVTLFALIFSIGILVDDAIVVVENIVRHFRLPQNRGRPLMQVAVEAVDEVGNPTILATLTVIAAILPMAFVSGLMGPYMRPIPVGASAAMIFSLFIAFIISPWAAYRLVGRRGLPAGDHGEQEGWTTRLYRIVMGTLIHVPLWRTLFLGGVLILLLVAVSLLYWKVVTVKMLPFDNKSEFQIIIDMPEGTSLEETARVTQDIGAYLRTVPEVTDYEMYIGTAGPFNFNGLVRHYFLRQGGNVADIQVNLVEKGARAAQSHDIAKRIRPYIAAIGQRYGARIKIAEIPPGPPVLQTLVAEVYGPAYERQIAVARQIREIFERTEGVVDVDWYVEEDQPKFQLVVDKEKAALHGISTAQITQTLRIAIEGKIVGLAHLPKEKEDLSIFLRLPRAERSSIEDLQDIRMQSASGELVPLRELVKVEHRIEEKSIYHKNLLPVVYVTGDVAGREESPVYAILKLNQAINQLRTSEGYTIERYIAQQPFLTDTIALKWNGE